MQMQLIIAILILACTQFGTQIILPALPEIAERLSISHNHTQQIIMLYFISFGLSQLVFGPWSDRSGQRKIFLYGQLLFIIGTLICSLAHTSVMLAIGRVIQGLGAGSPFIVSRTLLNASYKGNKLKNSMTNLAIAGSFVAVFSPLLGGWITTSSSWEMLFFVVAMYLSVTWLVGFKLLPHNKSKQRKKPYQSIKHEYLQLLLNPQFITVSILKWLPTMLLITSQSFFPFELQNKLTLTPQQYGYYMVYPSLGLVVGSYLTKVIQHYFSIQNTLLLFFPLLLLSGSIFYFQVFSLNTILIAYFLFMIFLGSYIPCSLQIILLLFNDKSGTANALTGAIEMFVFSIIAGLSIKFWVIDTTSLGSLYLLTTTIIAINLLIMFNKLDVFSQIQLNQSVKNN